MYLWTSVYRFMVVLVDRNTVDIYFSKGTVRCISGQVFTVSWWYWLTGTLLTFTFRREL